MTSSLEYFSSISTILRKPNSNHKTPVSSIPLKRRKFRFLATCSTKQESIGQLGQTGRYNIEFRTLEGCKLGISSYPDFEYNAKGGNGVGIGRSSNNEGDTFMVDFDVESLYIPALTSATTKFLGLPLPPFLQIDIQPETLSGSIDRSSGQVDLKFRSRFRFSAGSIYRPPPLMVETTLTSEESKGKARRGRGERMDGEGKCKLIGVAVVDPIADVLMNTFLSLPTECIAYLNAAISISSSST